MHRDPNGKVTGLDAVPADRAAAGHVVHLSFDMMVGIGVRAAAARGLAGLAWWRRRDLPGRPWFLRAVAVSGVAAVVAMEAGWVTTEVGRQPWIVYDVLRTTDAVNPAPGLKLGLLPGDRRLRRADRG